MPTDPDTAILHPARTLAALQREMLTVNPSFSPRSMGRFLCQVLFCLYAQRLGVMPWGQFTSTLQHTTRGPNPNIATVLEQMFDALGTPMNNREPGQHPSWTVLLPHIPGALFSGDRFVPWMSETARDLIVQAADIPWEEVQPDLFGCVMQNTASATERATAGMHYTTHQHIHKVLGPLFLQELWNEATDCSNTPAPAATAAWQVLSDRLTTLRVFDPACGTGNFLVVAYQGLRELENHVNERLGRHCAKTRIPLSNFRGIEIDHQAAAVAQIALLIAQYQCDAQYVAVPKHLDGLFAPNWITTGNALRLDWLSLCPPSGRAAALRSDDLFDLNVRAEVVPFDNDGGRLVICGNPPFLGKATQTDSQKADMKAVGARATHQWASLDYVAGWFIKGAEYQRKTGAPVAFIATNSICQGQHVPLLWPYILQDGTRIEFACPNFRWSSTADHAAGVTVSVVGFAPANRIKPSLYDDDGRGYVVDNISPYLVAGPTEYITSRKTHITNAPAMLPGNLANDQGVLTLSADEALDAIRLYDCPSEFIRPYVGALEYIQGPPRYCIWVLPEREDAIDDTPWLRQRFADLARARRASLSPATQAVAHVRGFDTVRHRGDQQGLIIPIVSGENRDYLPCGPVEIGTIVNNMAFFMPDVGLSFMAILSSRLHRVWIETVCGRLNHSIRYSNQLGWNTFCVPEAANEATLNLLTAARQILEARANHPGERLGTLYHINTMPADLLEAHRHCDRVVEDLYFGQTCRDDADRRGRMFALYHEAVQAEQRAV